MAKNIEQIAEGLGATIIGQVPDTGGGAFGTARMAHCIERLRNRLVPSQGKRTGRPSEPNWTHHPKVPMSTVTEQRLARLAAQASTEGRKVSPMQIAAQILEDALAGMPERVNH